jgi:hypothetical protein
LRDGARAITALDVVDWIDDGRGYACYYTSLLSTLFVVHGAMPWRRDRIERRAIRGARRRIPWRIADAGH